jgi:RNA polymerase sigma-70 factor (ECF subfamily)
VEIESTDERSFLDRAQAGDPEAFCELCRVHEARLLRQAMTICGNATAAEDLAQDTLVEAWKCLRRYNGQCQFFTWLCALLLNRYRNSVRKKRPIAASSLVQRDRERFRSGLESAPDPQALPDEQAQRSEQTELVLDCLQALSPKHHQIIYLRFYVDQSLEAIAAALGCSLGTVKSRLFHALEKLRGMRALHQEPTGSKIEIESI